MSFEVSTQRPEALNAADYVTRMKKTAPQHRSPSSQNQMPFTTKEPRKLIITRKLGFKKITFGLGQWQIHTKKEEECWICGGHICTLFLWSKEIGEKCSVNDMMVEEFFENEIERVEKEMGGPSQPISKRASTMSQGS